MNNSGNNDPFEYLCDCCPLETTTSSQAAQHATASAHYNLSVRNSLVNGGVSNEIRCSQCGESDVRQLHVKGVDVGCSGCLGVPDGDLRAFLDDVVKMHMKSEKKSKNERGGKDKKVKKDKERKEKVKADDRKEEDNKKKAQDVNDKKKDNEKRKEKTKKVKDVNAAKEKEGNVKDAKKKEDSNFVKERKDTTKDPNEKKETKEAKENVKQKREKNKKKKEAMEGTVEKQQINKVNGVNDKKDVVNSSKEKKQNDTNDKKENANKQAKNKTDKGNNKDKKIKEKKVKNATEKYDPSKTKDKLSKDAIVPKSSSPTPSETNIEKNLLLDGLTAEEIKVEDKFSKLKKIIKNTLPSGIKDTFDNMDEYYNFLVYSLLLEELFALDFCTDVEFDWDNEEHCTMSGSTKKWFDMFVHEDVHHLKKHPFVRDQTIFIVRQKDVDLNWDSRPDFWVARIARSTLDTVNKRGKKVVMKRRKPKHATAKKSNQASTFNLELYPWNELKFPLKEDGRKFAFLPASNVLTRIINSMNQIENKDFINLILGKQKIKRINFNNNIIKHFTTLNQSQKEALQSAFNNTVTILQGPPGSGKTSTIYEIILQLLENLHYYPILVVAASNLAVDNIAEKLMPQYKDNILRITSLSKEKEYPVDHPLGSVCLHNKISNILPPNLHDVERRMKRDFSSVSSAEFSKYLDACTLYGSQFVRQANIIFATTAGIAGPYLKNVKSMPVIIMDEATQSSEPSTLIPLGAKGCKKVILVGDTAQLSVFTRVKSLETSLFERVLKNGTYADPYMLDTQYRMHPDISKFPRRKFYDNKLKDGITAENRKKANINYPVYFYNHAGIGARESKQFSMSGEEYGFSWVNHKEVGYVERMVEKLLIDKQISPKNIGIMTGYAAQRDLIVKALEKNKLINPMGNRTNKYVDKEDLSEKKNVTVCNVNGIIVATVDAFQGREMDFVILSCVRSNTYNTVGFMSDPRRMNVALTRAKYSFILIGDVSTLSTSSLWKEYIEELAEKNYVKNSLTDY
ncbi:hypothetical protein CANINC_000486 [Pichia inconspicua]|uniref:AAA+ ATPase domain-containing protein n=1 Tax=Pichia inconspicua TaxID=52247 RepID=A0A4T0X7W9_9ASCO|nr:hypothetical protein CANINC_000486 [[Candida] inconspicua]